MKTPRWHSRMAFKNKPRTDPSFVRPEAYVIWKPSLRQIVPNYKLGPGPWKQSMRTRDFESSSFIHFTVSSPLGTVIARSLIMCVLLNFYLL